MIGNLNTDWQAILQSEIESVYFKKLMSFVEEQYQVKTCFPNITELYNSFNLCSFEAVRIVIIGQDPYHGKNQANGLCFSVHNEVAHPPSLRNILKELSTDLNTMYPASGDLSHWAKQGVLLLNATLSVEERMPGSHQKQGWEQFTDAVIQKISDKKSNVVFLLWGGYAKKKERLIDSNKHFILQSGHPSPLSANRGYWFGNKHFSATNKILNELELPVIDWAL